MAERRSMLRAVARIEIFDRDSKAERVPLYVSGNVSAGGMFLITQSPFAPGTNLKISFTLPGDSKPIQTLGQVVWRRTLKDGALQPGMGVQFMEIDRNEQERIRRFVQMEVDKNGPAPDD